MTADFWKRKRGALSWDGVLPEAMLFLAAIAFFIFWDPPRYDLIYVGAFAFLLAGRYAHTLAKEINIQPSSFVVIAAIILFAHLMPFYSSTNGNFYFTNYRQEELMNLAEQMTRQGTDLVYDDNGMVPTRRSVRYKLFPPGKNGVVAKGETSLAEDLAPELPVIIIAGYRFGGLAKSDLNFVHDRYVPISNDFWTLGKILPAGGGAFEIIHPGRYQITSAEASNIFGTYAQPENLMESLKPPPTFPALVGKLDGVPFDGKAVDLAAGIHTLECANETQGAVVWLGPGLKRIDRLTPGDHRSLFIH